MGRIGAILAIETNIENGEDIPIVKVDLGGGDVRRVPLFSAPGTDVRPRAGDYVALISNPGDTGFSAVGYADPDNTSEADDGETRLYARDASGAVVAEIFIQDSGAIRIENGSGFIELGATGQVNINNNLTVDP